MFVKIYVCKIDKLISLWLWRLFALLPCPPPRTRADFQNGVVDITIIVRGNILHQNCKCEIFMKQIECKLVQVLLNIAQLNFKLSTLPKNDHEPLICKCPELIGSFFNPGNVFLNRSAQPMIVHKIVQLFQQKTIRWHCTDHSYNFISYNSINTLLYFANLSAICRVGWIYSKVVNSWPCHNNA